MLIIFKFTGMLDRFFLIHFYVCVFLSDKIVGFRLSFKS